MNVHELLVGGIVGAVLGIVFERATSLMASVVLTAKYWRLRGTYEIVTVHGDHGGFFNILPGLGNDFSTEGWSSKRLYWTGNFSFDNQAMGSAEGVYRYLEKHDDRLVDWGAHHLMLLDDGDFVVQWHNVSHARDAKGPFTLHRVSRRVLRGEALPQ